MAIDLKFLDKFMGKDDAFSPYIKPKTKKVSKRPKVDTSFLDQFEEEEEEEEGADISFLDKFAKDPIEDYNTSVSLTGKFKDSYQSNFSRYQEIYQKPEKTPEEKEEMISSWQKSHNAKLALYDEQEKLNSLIPEVEKIKKKQEREEIASIEKLGNDPNLATVVPDILERRNIRNLIESEINEAISDPVERDNALKINREDYVSRIKSTIETVNTKASERDKKLNDIAGVLKYSDEEMQKERERRGMAAGRGGVAPMFVPEVTQTAMEERVEAALSDLPEEERDQYKQEARTILNLANGSAPYGIVNNRLQVAPNILFNEKAVKQAIEEAPASEVQKKAFMDSLPDLRERVAEAQMPVLSGYDEFQEFVEENNLQDASNVEKLKAFNEKDISWLGKASEQVQLGAAQAYQDTIGQIQSAVGAGLYAYEKVGLATDPKKVSDLAQAFAAAAGDQQQKVEDLQLLSDTVGGPKILADITNTGLQMAPVLLPSFGVGLAARSTGLSAKAASNLGFATAVAASGAQSFSSTYGRATEAVKDRLIEESINFAERELIDQGVAPEEAREQAQSRAMNEDKARDIAMRQAYLPAIISGLSTATVTALGGKFGPESITRKEILGLARNEGYKQAVKGFVRDVSLNAAVEAPEELVDQFIQGVTEKLTYNPEKTMQDIIGESLYAGAMGAGFGGAFGAVTYAATKKSNRLAQEAIDKDADLAAKQELLDEVNRITSELEGVAPETADAAKILAEEIQANVNREAVEKGIVEPSKIPVTEASVGRLEEETDEEYQARLNTLRSEQAVARIEERQATEQPVVEEPQGTRVEAAAYKAPDGTVFYGPSHLEAMAKARDEGKIEQAEIDAKQEATSRETDEFGYSTDQEGFVSRDQAEVIARASEQILVEETETGKLHSNEVELDAFPEGEGGVEPTVPVTPPVAPTPEGAVAPVEPVVAGPQPVAEVAPETDIEYISSVEQGDLNSAQKIVDDVAQKSGFLVHVTSPENVNQILSGGLKKSIPSDMEDTEGVYLFKDKASAEDAIMNWLGDRFPEDVEPVLLYVDPSGLPTDPNAAGFEVVVTEDIDSSRIKSAEPVLRDEVGNVVPLSQRFLQAAPAVTPPAEVAPEVTPTPETPNLEPLRRVAKAEQAPEDIPSLVEAGLVEVYKDQPVLTDAGLAALPEAERPRLTPEARKIQIDTGANEVVAEAIAKNLRIGVDQVGPNVTLPAGWTLDGDIYVPPAPQEAAPAPEVRESRREPAPLTQQDREYLDAVERGDLDAGSRAVEQAAKEAGYTQRWFHGTAAKAFNVFRDFGRKFIYFTQTRGDAMDWAKNNIEYARPEYAQGETPTPRVVEAFINADNIFNRTNEEHMNRVVDLMSKSDDRSVKNQTPQQLKESLLEENYEWYEEVAYKFIRQAGFDGAYIFESQDFDPYNLEEADLGILNPNLIKSADPVTRDDQGNIIPPSQRFQPTEEDIRYNPLGYDITTVVEDIKAGRTDGPLRAVNNVIKQSQELRDRVQREAARRQEPRARGKAAILDRLSRERASGRISEETAQALTDFVNRIREDAIGDTALSIRKGGVSNFNFGETLVSFFLNQDQPATGARVGIHEFFHGLSRFLPDAEVEQMRQDYTKNLAEYLKKNPWFLAFVGRYSLTPEQFEAYKLFNPKEAETKLQPVRDRQGNITKYQIKYDADNYRYIMLDEWIAEKMTDLVRKKQAVPDTFLGKIAKVIRDFLDLVKARLGKDAYESFYQTITDPKQKLNLYRMSSVAEPFQIYEPKNFNYAEDVLDQIRYADIQPADANEEGSNAETEAAVTQRAKAKKAQELVTGHSILPDEVPAELREEAQANYQNGMTLGNFLNPQFFNLGEAYNPYIAATWLELNGGLMPTVKVEGKEIAKPEKGTSEAEALRLLKRASDILDSRSETTGGKELTYSLQDIMATWMESGLGPAALKNAIVQFTNLDIAQADKTANDFANVYQLAQNVTATKERARVRMDRALPAVTARQQREKERMIKLEEAAGSIDSIAEAIRIAYDIGIKKPKTDKATEKKQIEEQLRQAKQILRDVVPKQYLGDQLLTLERATGLEGLKKVVEAAQNGLNQARLDEAVAGAKKSLDRAQKAVKANEIGPEAMAVLRDFVETYSKKGIGPETRAKIEDAISRYEADPVGALQDLATEKYLKQKGALGAIKIDKSLGLDALKEISRIINTTLHADRVARGEMLFNKQETRQEVIAGISKEIDKVKSIAKARKDGGQGIGLFNKIALYKGARVENILRAFGLNKLSEFVYDNLTLDAYQDELRVRRDLKKKIESRIKEITGLEIGTKDYDLYSKEIIELTGVDSSGRTKPIKVRRYELLDILASLRDPSNLKRAVNSGGYVIDRLDLAEVDTVKITPETYIEILNKATDQDNQMVDMMVELYNNDLFQILENASVQAYGHGIKAVSGTYYPRTADKWTRATEVKKDLDYIAYYQRRVDDVGYLKERDERSKSKLRAVDFLERLDYHVTNDARIGAYLPIVRDIEMVLGDPEIARPLASKIGEDGLNMIREMVRQQTTPPAGIPAGLLSTLVGNAGVGVLGFKLHAAMQNPVGIPIAVAYYGKDGFKYLAQAFPAGLKATKKSDRIEMASVLSKYAPYYNERYGDGGFIQEFTSGLSNAPSNRKWRKNLETAAMSWLEGTDRWGALVRYKLAQQVIQDRTTLEKGTEEFNEAVAREWTKMMFRSENTAHGADRTGVFQFAGRNPVFKVFIMFQSAVSKQYSLFAEAMLKAQQGGRENLRDAAYQLTFLSISLAASRAISNAFYSLLFPPDEDEEKTWGQLLGKVAGTPLSIVPVVGSTLQNLTETLFSPTNMRKPMQIDLISSFVFGVYDTMLLAKRALDEVSEDKIDEVTGDPKFWDTTYRTIKKAAGIAGIAYGTPLAGVIQTGELGFKLKERVTNVFNDEPKTEDFQKKVKEYEKEQRTEPVTQEYAKIFFAVTDDNQREFNRALKDLKAKRPDLSRKDVINAIRRRPEFRVVGMVRSGKMKQKDLEANGISRDYYLTQKALLRATEEAAKTMYRDSKD